MKEQHLRDLLFLLLLLLVNGLLLCLPAPPLFLQQREAELYTYMGKLISEEQQMMKLSCPLFSPNLRLEV